MLSRPRGGLLKGYRDAAIRRRDFRMSLSGRFRTQIDLRPLRSWFFATPFNAMQR